MIHELKIHPGPFAVARAGRKSFEIRRSDREFKHDDQVILREWDPGIRAYTGAELGPVPITCIISGYGLLDGYVVLGLGYGLPAFTPRMLDLQAEVSWRRADALRWGQFVAALAQALVVSEIQVAGSPAGFVEDHLLAEARRMAALMRPEAPGRLSRALGLIQEAADTWLMGSGARAKDKAAQAAVELTALIDGRA